MSAVLKVNIFSALGLWPFQRHTRRRPDNYQQATQDYAAKLRELYHSSVREKQRARRAQEGGGSESRVFVLDLSSQLDGITIDRASLPSAESNDRVLLIRVQDDKVPLARGIVRKINEQQIRIKFQQPLKRSTQAIEPASQDKKEPGDEEEQEPQEDDTKAVEAGESKVSGAKEDASTETGQASQEKGHQTDDTKNKTSEIIEFIIKFDWSQLREANRVLEKEHLRIIESTLHNFEKLKCNRAIHKNLLGLYDERSDLVNDKARVITFNELLARPNPQQKMAIEQALKRRLTLIEGPAGTGKTLVAAHIAANVCRLRQARVLVCSPVQSTVDRLTELLDRVGGLLVVKLPDPQQQTSGGAFLRAPSSPGTLSRRRDNYLNSEATQANHCHLDKLVDDEIYMQAYERSKGTLGSNHDRLHAHAYRMVTSCSEFRRRKLETNILTRASVVCCCIGQARSQLLDGLDFDMLVLDDVQVTSELDCLVAIMTRGLKQVAMLSDTRRLIRLARSLKGSQSERVPNGAAISPSSTQNSSSTTTIVKQPTPAGEADGQQHAPLAPVNSLNRRTRQANGTLTRKTRKMSITSESSQAVASNLLSQRVRGVVSQAAASLQPTLEPGNLFERLLALGLPTVDLRVQYRCHSTLSNFFIHHFYAGRLKDDKETNENQSAEIATSLMASEHNFDWLPNRLYLTFIFKCSSSSPTNPTASQEDKANVHEEPEKKPRKLNELVNKLLLREHIQESRIGIIYNKPHLETKLSAQVGRDIKEGTIDKFIGCERDFIILVAERSSPSGQSDRVNLSVTSELPCDFRKSDVSLNWALTRARLGLFIVAEDVTQGSSNDESAPNRPAILRADLVDPSDCMSWCELVKYYDVNKLIVD